MTSSDHGTDPPPPSSAPPTGGKGGASGGGGGPTGTTRKLLIAIGGLLLFSLLIDTFLIRKLTDRAEQNRGTTATQRQRPPTVPNFTLIDHFGRTFTNERLRGKWTFLFFGFTHCPDVCPTTMADLSAVWDGLPSHAKADAKVIMVSVDPQRDDAARLREWLGRFDPSFLGLHGDHEAVGRLSKPLGVHYTPTETDHQDHDMQMGGAEHGDMDLVDHTPAVFLIDPETRVRELFTPPHDPAELARRFQTIRAEYGY